MRARYLRGLPFIVKEEVVALLEQLVIPAERGIHLRGSHHWLQGLKGSEAHTLQALMHALSQVRFSRVIDSQSARVTLRGMVYYGMHRSAAVQLKFLHACIPLKALHSELWDEVFLTVEPTLSLLST